MGAVGRILLLVVASHLFVLAAALMLGAATIVGSTAAGALAVVLLLLPPAIAAALLPQRAIALPAVMGGWSLCALVAAPALLPYPAPDAVDAGFGLVGGQCQGIGAVAYTLLPDLSGEQPSAVAVAADCPVVAAPAPAPAPIPDVPEAVVVDPLAVATGDVVLHYEREGNSIIVPILFEGPSGPLELPMIFDTGATLTTLNQASLDALGLVIQPDAPEITSQTAGGLRTSQVTRTPGLTIGGHRVDTVTISQCEPCADEQARGLLGMNVSGRFVITIDTENQRLILRPRAGGQTKDVGPWVDLSGSAMQAPSGDVTVTLTAKNLAEQPISRVRVKINCEPAAYGEITDIPAEGSASTDVQLPGASDCDGYTIEVDEAAW